MCGELEIRRQLAIGKAVRNCNGDYKSVSEKFGVPEKIIRKVYEKNKKEEQNA